MVIGIGLDLVETARVERALDAARRALRARSSWTRRRRARCRPPAPSARRPGARRRGQGGGEQGAGDGLEPGRALARRGRLPLPRGQRCGSTAAPPRGARRWARAAGATCGSRSAGRSPSASSGSSRELRARPERNQLVTVAMVFAVFTGFAFVLPFLPLFVRELGVEEPERAALWAGVLIGIAPLLAGLLAPVWGRLADRHGHKCDRRCGPRVLRGHPRAVRRREERQRAPRAPDRHRPLRRHRPPRPGHGHRAGPAGGDRPRGRPHPGRADPLGGDRSLRRRAPRRHDRHPPHVPRHRGAVRAWRSSSSWRSTRSAATPGESRGAGAELPHGGRPRPG